MSVPQNVLSITFIILLVMLGSGVSADTPVRQCSNGAPLPLFVQVDTCSEMPCDLWKGSETQMVIQFVANRNDMTSLRAQVQFTTLGVQTLYDLDEEHSNVCQNLLYGAYCPLYRDEDVTYHLDLPIEEHQPEVSTKIEVSILDSLDNSVVSCFVVDGKFKKTQVA